LKRQLSSGDFFARAHGVQMLTDGDRFSMEAIVRRVTKRGIDLVPTSLSDVENWLRCLAALRADSSCPSPSFYRPYHFAMLAAEMRLNRGSFKLPIDIQKYATRMHLWQAIERTPPTSVGEWNPSGKFIPLTALRDAGEVDRIATELSEIVDYQSGGETSLRGVYSALAELLNNCFDHSESADGHFGLVCAQAWPRGRMAQVAIVDSGAGIRRTLSANASLRRRLASENACELATQYAISGKLGNGHSGYGLTLARDILRGNSGRLIVLSGFEAFYSGPNQVLSQRLMHAWPGTVIIFEWRTDKDLSARAVYDGWPEIED